MPAGKDSVRAAKEVTAAMTLISDGITAVAASSGALLANLDNDDKVPTLASDRAERAFQLVGALGRAYDDLAEFFHEMAARLNE